MASSLVEPVVAQRQQARFVFDGRKGGVYAASPRSTSATTLRRRKEDAPLELMVDLRLPYCPTTAGTKPDGPALRVDGQAKAGKDERHVVLAPAVVVASSPAAAAAVVCVGIDVKVVFVVADDTPPKHRVSSSSSPFVNDEPPRKPLAVVLSARAAAVLALCPARALALHPPAGRARPARAAAACAHRRRDGRPGARGRAECVSGWRRRRRWRWRRGEGRARLTAAEGEAGVDV